MLTGCCSGHRQTPLQYYPERACGPFELHITGRTGLSAPRLLVYCVHYYEHIIRNEKALKRIRVYIENNPAQSETDLENPKVAR